MSENNPLSFILEETNQRTVSLEETRQMHQKEMWDPSYDAGKTQKILENGLMTLQSSLVSIAKIISDRTDSFSNSIQTIENEIQAVDGMSTIIRGNAGFQYYDEFLANNIKYYHPGNMSNEFSYSPNSFTPLPELPANNSEINFNVTNGIGIDPSQGTNVRKPLVSSYKGDVSPNQLWRKAGDFLV